MYEVDGIEKIAGAHADRVERASECRERQQNLEVFERPSEAHTRKPIIKTHPQTGMKFWDMPLRRPLAEVAPKFPTPGLRVFQGGSGQTLSFEMLSVDPIDEADAIDAQCRAGWNDAAYGFNDFKTIQLGDGSFVAVWKCFRGNHD